MRTVVGESPRRPSGELIEALPHRSIHLVPSVATQA
jgi:hypothetical protein